MPAAATPEQLPEFRQVGELEAFARQYGIDRGMLNAAQNSTAARARMLQSLREHGLNGRSESVSRHLLSYHREFNRKRSWLDRLPIVGKPMNWVWTKVKRHPVLTSLCILGLATGGIGLYYSGLAKSLLKFLPSYIKGARNVGGDAAKFNVGDLALPGAGQHGGISLPTAPPAIPGGAGIEPF